MPKLNKPRHNEREGLEAHGDRTAAEWLDGLDLASIEEVTHFSDGSMSIVHRLDGRAFHTGIEFNPPLTAGIARYLIAHGIKVQRG